MILEREQKQGWEEWGRGWETSMQERHIDWLPLVHTLAEDQTRIWESNPPPFGLLDDAPTGGATVARAMRTFVRRLLL